MKVWVDANLSPSIVLFAHRVFPELGPIELTAIVLSGIAPILSYVLAEKSLAAGKPSVGLGALGTLLIPVAGCVYLILMLGPFAIFLPIAFFPFSLVPLILYPMAAFTLLKAYGKWSLSSNSYSVDQSESQQGTEDPESPS